jgi:hypothetical protein
MAPDDRVVPEDIFEGIDLSTNVSPREVQLIRAAINEAMRTPDPMRPGHSIGSAVTAIYAFYDYDGEPIYVGQTVEMVQTRVGRHLTGMRSDAVAKFVLDPFEVYAIAIWSIPTVEATVTGARERARALDAYEWTVHQRLTAESAFGAVLNEGSIEPAAIMELPEPVVAVLIPAEIFPARSHPDVRIGRRAQTIALLANRIAERKVKIGIRKALVVQTRRLNDLAQKRYEALGGDLGDSTEED